MSSKTNSPEKREGDESIRSEIAALGARYRRELLDDTVPFWIEHAIDRERGGYLFCLDRSGTPYDTDKPIWIHGRFVWLLSTLYRTVAKQDDWLELAEHGVSFLKKYGFDSDGRMFFLLDSEGRPLRKRRYLFSECFGVIGLAAYGRAAGDPESLNTAQRLFHLITDLYTHPDSLPQKGVPGARDTRGIGMPMMLVATARELYDATGDEHARRWIDRGIEEILDFHVKRSPYRVVETVGVNGEYLDHIDGRRITPGHIIEAGWFILDEAKKRGDSALVDEGTAMIDWAYEFGRDTEHGGILYYRDLEGKPETEYWHDMKFWWPHNEAIIAALLAYSLTRRESYLHMLRDVDRWSYDHFADPEYGEWIGYLHRDGRISTAAKGGIWKGPYHLPRMLLVCSSIAEEIVPIDRA